MGENTEIAGGGQHKTDRLREEIYHTQADISDTVHTIETRLSPSYLKRRATMRAKHYAMKGIADGIDFIQRKPVPVALATMGALLLLFRRKKSRSRQNTATRMELAGTAAKAFISGAAGKAAKEAPQTGKALIWKGLATAIGAALGTTWYRRKPTGYVVQAGRGTELPRAGAYPGMDRPYPYGSH